MQKPSCKETLYRRIKFRGGKLKLLNASSCTKLRIFPNAIKSTYLEDLNLTECSRLKFPKNIWYQGRYAKGFFGLAWWHVSIEKWSDGSELIMILWRDVMIPKIKKLMNSFGLMSKCKGQDQGTVNSLVSSNLIALRYRDCSLIDEYLSTLLGFFPHFEDLDFCTVI